MSIRVTCPGCHTRFNVSEKFAGKEGPCPKCKKPIKIPAKSEEVQVHTPQSFGPKSAEGKAVLKPIFRNDTSLSPVQIVLIVAVIIGFLAVAALIRGMVENKAEFSTWILLGSSVVLAFPTSYAAYMFLRDSELEAFRGQDLLARVGACSVVYGLLWLAIPLMEYAFDDDLGTASLVSGMLIMFGGGAATAVLIFGMDFLIGILHYGMFIGCCILLRWIAGFGALPGMLESPPAAPEQDAEAATAMLLQMEQLANTLCFFT